jgi:asparagine synthase (glutamine-hydrolyzing)
MASRHGRYVTVFNGEIYNFRDLRQQLLSTGASFRGSSDTEVLLAAFEQWGIEDAVCRFAGMFAITVWDRERSALTLVRDRIGEKPLYYGWCGETLLFGSELKALRMHPAWRGDVDRNALALFMRHGYVPAPYSIYRGILKVSPGTFVTIRAGHEPEVTTYWSALAAAERGLSEPLPADEHAVIGEIEETLRRTIAEQMIADVPLGAFLSGGIDSSLVVAIMQSMSTERVRTFSIGFRESGFDESGHAKAVANHVGTDHVEEYVSARDMLDVVPLLPSLYDEPFADSSQVPTYLVARMTRRHVKVSLSGDGGDELFGGYNRYMMALRLWPRLARVPVSLRRGAAAGIESVKPERWTRIGSSVLRFFPSAARVPEPGDKLHKFASILAVESAREMYRDLVSHWRSPNAVVIGGHEYPSALTRDEGWGSEPDLVSYMMHMDQISYLPDDILVKVDRATMGVSLESRAPFLDHRMVELAWRTPIEYRMRNGTGKWPLRQLLYRYVPRSLVDRPKQGFAVPLAAWLRGDLFEWAEDLLSRRRLDREGFFNSAYIRQKWDEHISGRRNWQYPLWNVLMFQAWHESVS